MGPVSLPPQFRMQLVCQGRACAARACPHVFLHMLPQPQALGQVGKWDRLQQAPERLGLLPQQVAPPLSTHPAVPG